MSSMSMIEQQSGVGSRAGLAQNGERAQSISGGGTGSSLGAREGGGGGSGRAGAMTTGGSGGSGGGGGDSVPGLMSRYGVCVCVCKFVFPPCVGRKDAMFDVKCFF